MSGRRRRARRAPLFVIAFLTCVLSGPFAARAGTATPIPASAAASPKDLWRAVMETFYGSYDRRLKCWIGEIEGARQCMRPLKLDIVRSDGRERYFVATGGYPLTEAGGYSDCHACAGSLGLIVLEGGGARLDLVARNSLAEPAGAWGVVPPEESFRLREIGKGQYGWTMESGWSGQGYNVSHEAIFGVSGSDVVELGQIQVHSDNAGTCGEGLGECYVRDYELVFDAASGADHYDIVLRRLADSTAGPETIRVPFDTAGLKYAAPDDLLDRDAPESSQ